MTIEKYFDGLPHGTLVHLQGTGLRYVIPSDKSNHWILSDYELLIADPVPGHINLISNDQENLAYTLAVMSYIELDHDVSALIRDMHIIQEFMQE